LHGKRRTIGIAHPRGQPGAIRPTIKTLLRSGQNMGILPLPEGHSSRPRALAARREPTHQEHA